MNINDMITVANPLQGIADLTGYSANQLNREQFNEQMAFSRYQFQKQIEMANSAHQREMKDLKTAGLNPVLTAMGGQGANSASGVHMPGIPDNSVTQRGMQGILSAIMSLAPQIAEMKNANAALTQAEAAKGLSAAQSTKLLAEAGKIGTEKEIAQLTKLMEGYKWKHYPDIIESQISKSPLWLVQKAKDMFNTGTNTSAAKNFEKLGENLFKAENFGKNITKQAGQKGKELLGQFIIKMIATLI